METKLVTVEAFAQARGIVASVKWADANPNMDDMGPGARHFVVTLRRTVGGRKLALSLPFSQGSAHTQEPTAVDVLDCLASDAAGYDNARGFDDWAGEYGYDADSRKAERIWKTVAEQRDRLHEFLGAQSYDELLYKTERR